MKIGVTLYSFGAEIRSGKISVKEALSHVASLGVKGVEIIEVQHLPNWPQTKTSEIVDLKDYIKSLGMEICCFSSYLPTAIRSDRLENFEEILMAAKHRIILADILEAKIVRPIYYGHDFKSVVDLITEMIPFIEKYNKIWGLEIHAPYPPRVYLEAYLDYFNVDCVKLIPDFSCWEKKGLPTMAAGEPVESLIDLIPYTCHVHGKAHEFNENGEEANTPYKELIDALKKGGFDGYIVAEYEGWSMKEEDDSKEIVEKHLNLIKKYI